MTYWKNKPEKRTPFLSRGTGRIREVEETVDELRQQMAGSGMQGEHLCFVTQLPADHADHPDTLYIVYE